jgi:threonine dehydrogenase-like Zn-dependent dehydrogenase
MRAVVVGDDRAPALATVPAPRPRAGEVLVGVRVVGLCGSDVEKLAGGTAVAGAVLGHEVAGVVLDGALPAGTRVTVAHHVGCGACARCLSGHETTCLAFAASSLRPGGFAEQLVASAAHVASTVLPLPDEVADADGALVEPLACVVRAAGSLPTGRGAVVGCGAMGLLFCRLLRARGQGVVVLDPDAARMLRALDDADAPAAANDELDCSDFKAACDAHERKLLEAALRRCRFNQRLTAKALALTYDQLRHALRRHDLLQAGGS